MLLGWCQELSPKIWQQNQLEHQGPKTWLYFKPFAVKQRRSYAWVSGYWRIPCGAGISTEDLCISALIILFAEKLDKHPWPDPCCTPAVPSCQRRLLLHGWAIPEPATDQWNTFVPTPGATNTAKVASQTTMWENSPSSAHWTSEQRAACISGSDNPLEKSLVCHQLARFHFTVWPAHQKRQTLLESPGQEWWDGHPLPALQELG